MIPQLPLAAETERFRRSTENLSSTSSETADQEFIAALDDFLISEATNKNIDFKALTKRAFGAWPRLVSERLTVLGAWQYLQKSHSVVEHSPRPYAPELHLNLCEWYFSSSTAHEIASEFLSRDGFNLLCGTPTIALRAVHNNSPFLLVDKNPVLGKRFPILKGNLINCDVCELNPALPKVDCIVLDAPWYVPTILHWLSVAARAATTNTKIVMPLFRKFTRPLAYEDRKSIQAFAETIGKVTIIPDCVEYDSPLFEWEALAASETFPDPKWRRADLMCIEVGQRPTLSSAAPPLQTDEWETYLIGTQVIQIRMHRKVRNRSFLLRPTNDGPSFVLDTVSARDSRRPITDILSSRNRAATVGNFSLMRYVLTMLSQSDCVEHRRIPDSVVALLNDDEIRDLKQFLCWDTPH